MYDLANVGEIVSFNRFLLPLGHYMKLLMLILGIMMPSMCLAPLRVELQKPLAMFSLRRTQFYHSDCKNCVF